MPATKILQDPATISRIDNVKTVSLSPLTGKPSGYRVLIADPAAGTSTGTGTGSFAGKVGKIVVSDGSGGWTVESNKYYPKEQVIVIEEDRKVWIYNKANTSNPFISAIAETKNSTYKGLQVVGEYLANATSVGSTTITFDTSIDFTLCDVIEFEYSNNSGTQKQLASIPANIPLGYSGGLVFWYDTTHTNISINTIADRKIGRIRAATNNGTIQIHKIRGLAYAENGFVVPGGTVLATKRKVKVSSSLNSVNDGESLANVLEGIPTVVKVDLATDKAIDVSALTDNLLPCTSGSAQVINPNDGLILVTAGSADAVVTVTETKKSTYKGIQIVGEFNLNKVIPAAGITETTGIDLTLCDIIEFEIATDEENYHRVVRMPAKFPVGNADAGMAFWHSTGYVKVSMAAIADRKIGKVKLTSINEVLKVYKIRGLSYAEYGFVVPTGTTLIKPTSITATLDGSPAKFLSSGSNTVVGRGVVPNVFHVDLGSRNMLLNCVASDPAVSVAVLDRINGVIEVGFPDGTSAFSLTLTSGLENSDETLLVDKRFVNNSGHDVLVPILGGLSVGTIIDTYQFLRVEFFEDDSNRFFGGNIYSTASLDSIGHYNFIACSYNEEYRQIYAEGTSKADRRAATSLRTYSGGMGSNSRLRIWGIKANVALPVGYVTPALRTITISSSVPSNITFVDGSRSVKLLDGFPSTVVLSVPAGRQINPANPSLSAGNLVVKNGALNELYIVPSGDGTLTVSTQAIAPSTKERMTLSGSLNINYNNHNGVTNLSEFTRTLYETQGAIALTNTNIINITRDMLLNISVLLRSDEGPNINLWPRLQIDRNDGDGFATVAEDSHGNPSGVDVWQFSATVFVEAGNSLSITGRINENYPGARPCKINIVEL